MRDLSDYRAFLARTPSLLAVTVADLPGLSLLANEGPGSWSVRDVVAHLCDMEGEDWIRRVRLILDEDVPQYAPIGREDFRERLADMELHPLISQFTLRRRASLESLDEMALTSADLQRRARHPALGEVTLAQLLGTWVVHDITHMVQIERLLAEGWRTEVGPWSEYLSVLGDQGRRLRDMTASG